MLLGIARMMAAELQDRLRPKSISLHMSDAALRHAVACCVGDLAYGARPLRRWLEQHVITDLSRMLIAGELAESCSVACDVQRGGQGGLQYAVEAKAVAGGGSGGVLGSAGFKRQLDTAPSRTASDLLDDQDGDLMQA
jgi:ATP-dependent Clp protease ATP-binding subunit ClpB